MKVAIGMRVRPGPWGGGNRFAISLAACLTDLGDEVVFDLRDSDVDVIVLTEPRRSSISSAFDDVAIFRYLLRTNPRALVVHRVNECDERKGSSMVNRRLALANRCADHTVFISHWLMELFASRGFHFAAPSVVLNGADRSIFHDRGSIRWDESGPLRLVTHHWSDNWMKGFDIYLQLDELLAKSDFARHFAYTYIGNLPPAVRFRHVRHVAPLSGTPLADELRRHHVYLTASIHEPAGMHHIEAALCGLPLLYRRSGALPEYCDGFGVGFDQETFEGKLFELRDRYWKFRPIMTSYSYDASRMCRGYIDLFRDLMSRRDEILARRSWGRAASIQMQWTASAYQACYTLLQRWKHSR